MTAKKRPNAFAIRVVRCASKWNLAEEIAMRRVSREMSAEASIKNKPRFKHNHIETIRHLPLYIRRTDGTKIRYSLVNRDYRQIVSFTPGYPPRPAVWLEEMVPWGEEQYQRERQMIFTKPPEWVRSKCQS